ncbi:MAG: hypothetical protein VKK59_06305 [Vampirovibrionales bacterium]|nr:hypothetical protein [Vampirovibrionales bacterium]
MIASPASILTLLRSNNLLNSATKEFWGANVPHVTLVQSKNEMVDQAINQFGNLWWVFGVTYAFSKGFDHLLKKVVSKDVIQAGVKHAKALTFKKPHQQAWYVLGKSLATYLFAGTYVMHSAFLRNWLTWKRTGAVNYTEMVGFQVNHTPQQVMKAKQSAHHDIHRFLKGMAIGLSAAVGVAGLTMGLVSKKVTFPKFLKGVNRHFGLPGGDYAKMKDLPLYFYWALPSYLSLFLGSRDPLEKKEVLWRAGGFGLAFMILPRTIEKWVNRAVKGKVFKHVGSGKNVAFLAQLASGIVFYASLPTVLNLVFRKNRAQKLGLLNSAVQPLPLPSLAAKPITVNFNPPTKVTWPSPSAECPLRPPMLFLQNTSNLSSLSQNVIPTPFYLPSGSLAGS